MWTAVLAWIAALACCLAAAAFGQTARSVPARRRALRRRRARLGVLVSRSGSWLASLICAGIGAWTGAWVQTAAASVAGVLLTALIGLALAPH